MDKRYIWLNEEIKDVEDAKINVLSPTAQFGANVFEGIRAYWNEEEKQLYIFRLKEHLERLRQSMRLFRIECKYTNEELVQFIRDIIIANEYQDDIAIRQTVFVDGMGSWFSTEPMGMFIAPIKKARKESPIASGEKTCISSWERISERNMSPRVKVGANYINSRLAKLEAMDNGYDSAVFLNNLGYVAEGTGSCIFLVKANKLITPMLTDSILASITRDTVIRIAKELLDMEVEERSVTRTELYTCDEAFFCGSAVEITPIVKFDAYYISEGKPGMVTQTIHKKYLEIVTGNNILYNDWLTPVYE